MKEKNDKINLTDKDVKMLFSMIIKLSNDVSDIAMNSWTHGWFTHSEENEYFTKRLRELLDNTDIKEVMKK